MENNNYGAETSRQKQIAVITGASSGLGREYVKYLVSRFVLDEFWLIARRKERLEELAASIPVPSRLFSLDLSEDDHPGAPERSGGRKPAVRFLINAAGFGKKGNYKDIPLEELDRMVLVNCKAMMDVTQVCIPYTQKGSRILEISSVASFQPLPGFKSTRLPRLLSPATAGRCTGNCF